jgi:adhesin transport system outer membrane protein
LTEVLQSAANTHPSVLQARSQYEGAGYDVESAKWGRFPSITTQALAPNNRTQSLTKVEQPLWTGGRITGQIQVSEANERAALSAVLDAQTNAMVQVSTSFFDFLRMQMRMVVANENVREHQKLADLIGRRVKSEVSPMADDVLANARLQQAITERIQIQKAMDTARLSLEQWTGLSVSRVSAPRQLNYMPNPSVEALVQKTFDFSGQRNKLMHQVDSAMHQMDVVKSQALPSVVAGYQHVWGGLYPNSYQHNSAYVSLQFQPGAGLSALSNRNAAAMKQDAVKQELLTLERNLRNQVLSSLADIESAQTQLKPARTLLDGTSEVVASYLRQYQVGRRTWVEVLNAQREMTQAAYGLIDLQVALQQSQVRLMLLSGDITPQEFGYIHE